MILGEVACGSPSAITSEPANSLLPRKWPSCSDRDDSFTLIDDRPQHLDSRSHDGWL
jgi:hypothetical protein